LIFRRGSIILEGKKDRYIQQIILETLNIHRQKNVSILLAINKNEVIPHGTRDATWVWNEWVQLDHQLSRGLERYTCYPLFPIYFSSINNLKIKVNSNAFKCNY
jgi:hypothetical protein